MSLPEGIPFGGVDLFTLDFELQTLNLNFNFVHTIKRRSPLNRITIAVLLVAGLLAGMTPAMSQEAPIYDTPLMSPINGATPGVYTPDVVTSADGYDNFDIGTDFAEPHMSSNPLNPTWYFNAFNTNAAHRTSNGFDWTSSTPAFGATMRGDPVTAYDSLGNLYYENMFGSPNILGCKVMRSTNNGATWGASVTAINGVDKNWIACDQTSGPFANYVYTVMTHNLGLGDPNFGSFARSTNFGATWDSTWAFADHGLPGMMVAVGPNVLSGNNIPGGVVYVVTNSGSSFAATYGFHRSTDGGVTFSLMSSQNFANYVGTNVAGRNSVQNFRTRPYPFIAADNSYGTYRGRLYLVYASNNPSGDGNKSDIYSRYSTNQGTTWSSAVTINNDPGSTANYQWHPSIWCDKETGRLYCKWLDTRNVPTSDSCEVYASYSDDGGVTWVANQKISNAKFKINCTTCNGGTPAYLGDYDAITSNNLVSQMVWTDFRFGTFRSFVGYFPDFAMLVSKSNVPMNSTEVDTNLVYVPSVKLYTGTAQFSATVSPAANITFDFPDGDLLTSYPDTAIMRITTAGVAPGAYTVTVVGQGANGTPIHKRTFTVTVPNPTITLTAPNGSEVWPSASSKNITWTSVNPSTKVKIELARNGVTYSEVLFDSVDNDGLQAWTVTGPGTTSARMRISNVYNGAVLDVSNAFFTIASLTVTSPDGGEDLYAGTSHTLAWSSAAVTGNVNIMLSRDGGATFPEALFSNVSNDGTESWTVTGPATANARLGVASVTTPAIVDTSDADFTISLASATMAAGWNLVSLPVTLSDTRVTTNFPTASSPAYEFLPAGYVVRDSLEWGKGYWLRFNSADVVPFPGSPRDVDTVDVPYGWSLFGSITYSVPIDSIEQIPPGIVDGFYSYAPGVGYQANPPSVEPGVALWLNANQAGQLILRKPLGPKPALPAKPLGTMDSR